mmetsp:Transcript_79258/g.224361  ORF Transcript_79258/g.224361 Transcript_79258/m.224361 type:complete len:207 (+) Transcript_79258:98-718(+)
MHPKVLPVAGAERRTTRTGAGTRRAPPASGGSAPAGAPPDEGQVGRPARGRGRRREELVRQSTPRTRALLRVQAKQVVDEVVRELGCSGQHVTQRCLGVVGELHEPRQGGHVPPEVLARGAPLLEDLGQHVELPPALEQGLPQEHLPHDAADAPHVHRRAVKFRAVEQLGSAVRERGADRRQGPVTVSDGACEAEVANLGDAGAIL